MKFELNSVQLKIESQKRAFRCSWRTLWGQVVTERVVVPITGVTYFILCTKGVINISPDATHLRVPYLIW